MSGHHHHRPGEHQCHRHRYGTAWSIAVSLAGNAFLTALKWIAFAFTRSPSLFGEAMHSSADLMNPLVLWIGHRRSQRPKCDQHPLGHGREAFFWSLMAAQMMFLVGAVATAYHGIESLVTGRVPELSWVAGSVMLIALVVEGYSLLVAWRSIKSSRQDSAATAGDAIRSKNPIVLALVLENGVDMLGVVLAVCGYGLYVLTGDAFWDGVFSLCIAVLLTTSSVFLIRRNLSLITGEAADQRTREKISEALKEIPTVLEVEEIVATMTGPEEVRCRVTVKISRLVLAEEFRASPHQTCRFEDAIYWTVSRVLEEKRKIAKAITSKVPSVISVQVECR